MSVIRTLLQFYIYILIADAILSYFPELERHEWRRKIRQICNYTCAPIRKRLPPNLPVDFSPLVVILLIQLLMFLW